jgi:hypothetical protein
VNAYAVIVQMLDPSLEFVMRGHRECKVIADTKFGELNVFARLMLDQTDRESRRHVHYLINAGQHARRAVLRKLAQPPHFRE